MTRFVLVACFLPALAGLGCRGDKSFERRCVLHDIAMSWNEYATKYGTLPVAPGETIEGKVPMGMRTCPICGKPWSYAKTTMPPEGVKDWNPIIAWCANCEGEGGKVDALFYYGKTIPVSSSELPR